MSSSSSVSSPFVASSFDPYDYTSWWTLHLFLALWALVWILRSLIISGLLLPKFTRSKFLELWERRKRNVLTYCVSFLFTTIAFCLQLYGGWNILFDHYDSNDHSNNNDVDSDADIPTTGITTALSDREIQFSVLSIQLVCIVYVWELIYRERVGYPLLSHHFVTLLFLQLLLITNISLDPAPILYLRLALLVTFFATTNQMSFVALFTFRLKIFNPQIQRYLFWVAAVQTFLLKAILTGGCAGYYFVLVFGRDDHEDPDQTFDTTPWGTFWKIAFLPFLLQTFVAHFYVSQMLLTLSQRQMTVLLPQMSHQAVQNMHKEYRSAFLTLEAYENARSSSLASAGLKLHYRALLGSHYALNNDSRDAAAASAARIYSHKTGRHHGGDNGGGESHTARDFGFRKADVDIPNPWNELLSSFPGPTPDDDRFSTSCSDQWSTSINLSRNRRNRLGVASLRSQPTESDRRPQLSVCNTIVQQDEEDAHDIEYNDDDDEDISNLDDGMSHRSSPPPAVSGGTLDIRRLFGLSFRSKRRSGSDDGTADVDNHITMIQSQNMAAAAMAATESGDDADSVFAMSFGKEQQEATALAWSTVPSEFEEEESVVEVPSPLQSPCGSESSPSTQEPSPPQSPSGSESSLPTPESQAIAINFLTSSSPYRHQPPLEDVPEEAYSASNSSNNTDSLGQYHHLEEDDEEEKKEGVDGKVETFDGVGSADDEYGDHGNYNDEEGEDLYAQSSPSSSSSTSCLIESPPPLAREHQNSDLPFSIINVKTTNNYMMDNLNNDRSHNINNDAGTEFSVITSSTPSDDEVHVMDEEAGRDEDEHDDPQEYQHQRVGQQPVITTNERSIRLERTVREPNPHQSVLPAYSEHLDLAVNSSSLVDAPTGDTSFEFPGEDYDVFQMRT